VHFEQANLFEYEPNQRADLVISLGVLHHTPDCHAALRRVMNGFVADRGHVFIGLYHKYGREPFLQYFEDLKRDGASDEDLLKAARKLGMGTDDVHVMSWFRDQVLHPHETQHTLEEILPILDECGFRLSSTSINRFGKFSSHQELIREEKKYAEISRERLRQSSYFPGFFVILAQKN